jgi:hypothetical protein
MNESDNPESRLHGLFVVLFYISLALLAIASASIILNGLDNFLHAPIGIKDNPPEPGIVVQLAQLAWIPLLLSVLLFGILRAMSLVFKSVPRLLVEITIYNRGPEQAALQVLPTLWFRNSWTWWPGTAKPTLTQIAGPRGAQVVVASHVELGERYLYCDGDVPLLFTENETNSERLFATPNDSPYAKDAIDNYVVHGKHDAVNAKRTGTKVASQYQLNIDGGSTGTIRLRLSDLAPNAMGDPFKNFSKTMEARRRQADAFYKAITPESSTEDEASVLRQASAGMLWSKQFFFFDVDKWLKEHSTDPLKQDQMRNSKWRHMMSQHIISMPDKWEYPWYASWDLAFQTIALSTVDLDLAKEQLSLLLSEYVSASDRANSRLRVEFQR